MTHRFMVATHNLETSVDELLSMEEYSARDPRDFPPNRHWFCVTVRSPEDQDAWVQAYNDMLVGKWTPNQTYDDRQYYGEMIDAAKAKMAELEVEGL